MRILILIAIGLLLYVIINNLLRKNRSTPSLTASEKMVKCQHCGLHILEQESVQSGKNYYCSQQHLEADQSN